MTVSDLCIGDPVRIIKPEGEAALKLVDRIGFTDEMEEMIGEERYITAISTTSECDVIYRLNDTGWVFAREWLEPVVTDPPLVITEEDFDSIWN